MDYIIIGLLIVILILIIISLFKNINESNITERLGKLELSMNKDLSSFRTDLTKDLHQDFELMNDK
ncbi:MAG: hypothetical protein RSE91_01905, partial [Bacilli bacterium]